MSRFAKTVEAYWDGAFSGEPIPTGDRHFVLGVGRGLDDARRVMVLDRGDGVVRAVLTAELADQCALRTSRTVTLPALTQALSEAGVTLNAPDRLFYLPAEPMRPVPSDARRLSDADRAAFLAFEEASPPSDREEAFVELDHMIVFGVFADDRLVSAASLYPWHKSRIADLGVLTRSDARGRGHGLAVVRALCAAARAEGYEPQFRCRQDNDASVALANAAGLRLFGDWKVALPPVA